ncbi:hypothetical protein ACFPER_09795 [Agromyces aurantiacus]|uniref:Uncharacterized protein n=1 Tax=Agromyces aurantiacus TaxID=165814 RepID=A0ABV9R748_9MICO|nr:hypothetical protein [Agromyces aurantiacus]MBM7503766.1 hypothetical protein [Agromyces aurantiacus]
MAWFPPNVDPVEHSALVPGIPPWVEVSVLQWVTDRIVDRRNGSIRPDFLAAWDVAMRNHPPHQPQFANHRPEHFWERLDEAERLALLDFLLFVTSADNGERLEALLRAGGSEWRVGRRTGNAGLERRVPQGVVDAAEAVMATSSTAGALLSEAWHAAFGRSPNPEEAYEKAIKAVEEAGASVVSPRNGRATLGTMIRDMESQGNWVLPLSTSESTVPVAMARGLWQGQESRHGGNGYRTPTPEEAEAAVLLAVPLVQWFSSGALQRRPITP